MMKLLTRFGVLIVLSLAVGCGGSGKGAKSTADSAGGGAGPAEIGKPAPDLSIQPLNASGKISLESLKGKVVVLDFWATWCAPCKQSFPKLEELSKKVGDKVAIVGISVDDEKRGVLDFAKENGATFAIGWDEGHAIASRWNVEAMPTTFIVDARGIVRFIHAGYHDGETTAMEKELASLEEAGSPSTAVTTKVATNDEKKIEDDSFKNKNADDGSKKKDDEKVAEAAPARSTSLGEDQKPEPAPPPKKKGAKKATRAPVKAPPAAPAKKHAKKKAG